MQTPLFISLINLLKKHSVYLAGLHKSKVSFGISSRGQGNVVERNGKKIVEDDFDLETWDVVYNPSVKHARPTAVESKKVDTGLTESTLKEGDAQPGYDLPVETHNDLQDALFMMGFHSEDGIRFYKEGNDQKVTCSIDSKWETATAGGVESQPGDYTVNCAGETHEFSTPAEVWQFISSKETGPVMAEVYPMEPKKHVEMCMQTLEDFGFVFPNNIPDVEPKEGLNEEEQMKHYLQTLLDQGHTWDWDYEKAPKYIQENYNWLTKQQKSALSKSCCL